MKLLDISLSSLLLLIPLIHLLLAPHTKVEESFPLQATHDILVYGTPTTAIHSRLSSSYDHFSFPGAVPRTFVGPVLLAGVSQPLVALVGFRHAQLVVRAVLGAFNAGCLLVFRGGLERAFGLGVARWWVVFLVSQFHVVFYLTRTLPNMFAFGLTTLASAFLLPRADAYVSSIRRRQAIVLLIFSGVIFRSEIAILLVTTVGQLLFNRQVSLRSLIPLSLGAFLAALLISLPVDSYFWQKPLWPELWGFYYNAVLGSSSDWGVSPWHYYFTSAIPRLLLNPLAILLIPLALCHPGLSRQARDMILPSVLFIAIYSLQPHKETRFIFYAVPPLTGAAALAANFITSRRTKSTLYRFGSVILPLSTLATFAASTAMLLLSSLNYPGGDALAQLHALTRSHPAPALSIHADVLTCMTGLTRFGENHAGVPLAYHDPSDFPALDAISPVLFVDKTENDARLGRPGFWRGFDYVLAEDLRNLVGVWDEVGVVLGYDGVEILTPNSPAPEAELHTVLGKGAVVGAVRDFVRSFTGGWWAGPRMSPRIHIVKHAKSVEHV